jgi:hypothetical protein
MNLNNLKLYIVFFLFKLILGKNIYKYFFYKIRILKIYIIYIFFFGKNKKA